jgi:hypothetical protein
MCTDFERQSSRRFLQVSAHAPHWADLLCCAAWSAVTLSDPVSSLWMSTIAGPCLLLRSEGATLPGHWWPVSSVLRR